MVYVEDLSNAQYSSSINGECWRAMVRNPVIALGYPVPKREERMQGSGLEVSLDLMVALSRADWATTFGGTLLLMGITSALVAKRAVGKSIVWHLLVNKGAAPHVLDIRANSVIALQAHYIIH